MSRCVVPHVKGRKEMAEGRLAQGNMLLKSHSRRRTHGGVLVMDRHRMNSAKRLDEGIKSAIQAQSRDLSQILEEVDGITKRLKSNPLEAQALSEALHRTVLCAIKQSIMDRELRSLALSDDLTGLYNRRAFYAMASQQIKATRRKGQGLLLLFADVDYLKYINDTYGHREGDFALVRVADALERTFRSSDIVGRLSGDEFAVLALEASRGDEGTILRRLEQNLQDASADERRYKLSLSVGVVRFDPKNDMALGDLLEKADKAMYEQKNAHPELRMSRR
jgi:diguanylate cyclase (GGDEF)-like protein